MTGPGNFILRWSRLKREANAHPASGHDGEAAVMQPSTDTAADEAFDPAMLPSIEEITAETDISGFLRGSVPRALATAALRKAWTSDPAIRDFIGIAENQWDFNDPNAIFGFGPMQTVSNAPVGLTQVIDECATLPETLSKSMPETPAHPPLTEVKVSAIDTVAPQSANETRNTNVEAGRPTPFEDIESIPNRRRHGSAIPH